jgi:murein DD-endopeptidase MepM/ murein hydrolase activator NlpD
MKFEPTWPFTKRYFISSKFGEKRIRDGRMVYHSGLDVACAEGTLGRPIFIGFVTTVAFKTLEGKFLIVDHGTDDQGRHWTSAYCHCKRILVEEGDAVLTTRDMFEVGHTGHCKSKIHGGKGDHLHLTLRRNGIAVNPLLYLKPP